MRCPPETWSDRAGLPGAHMLNAIRRCWATHVFWICILSAGTAACLTKYLLIRYR